MHNLLTIRRCLCFKIYRRNSNEFGVVTSEGMSFFGVTRCQTRNTTVSHDVMPNQGHTRFRLRVLTSLRLRMRFARLQYVCRLWILRFLWNVDVLEIENCPLAHALLQHLLHDTCVESCGHWVLSHFHCTRLVFVWHPSTVIRLILGLVYFIDCRDVQWKLYNWLRSSLWYSLVFLWPRS